MKEILLTKLSLETGDSPGGIGTGVAPIQIRASHKEANSSDVFEQTRTRSYL